MSDEKKPSDSETSAVDGFFDSLIEDFDLEKSGKAPEVPHREDDDTPKCMRDFSKFFEDAAAFGSGFESTIDKAPSEITDGSAEETVSFTGSASDSSADTADREIITTPVTDEDGMIVIFDEEAGIDATSSAESENIASNAQEDVSDEAKPDTESTKPLPSMILGEETVSADDEPEDELVFGEMPEKKFETDSGDISKSENPADTGSDDDKFAPDDNISSNYDADDDVSDSVSEEKKRSFIQGILPWKGDSVPEIIRKIVFIASTGVFIAAGIMLISTLIQSQEAQSDLEDIKESVTTTAVTSINESGEVVTVPPTTEERREHNESLMNSFVEISGNVKGFIELPGCDIYYPVVQGTDNEYYLTHTYDDRKNKAGSVFMDYRCTVSEDYTSPNIVLYGHNQEDGTMFGNLRYYKNNVDFYKQNPSVVFNTEYDIGDYVIFGYFITNVYEHQDSNGEVFHYHDYIETLSDESTFNWYMNEVGERNQIISPVDVAYGDKLLVLSTCSNEYSDSRFVVMARKLREGESISDFDFSSARLNPYARQIDWSAILSEETVSEESEETESSMTEEETTVTTIPETSETTVTTTVPETSADASKTKASDAIVSQLSLAPKYENGTTASVYSETEATEEETTLSEITETSPTGPVLATQAKPR